MKAYFYDWKNWLYAGSFLLVGCMIYLLYRPTSIIFFDIISQVGLMSYAETLRDYACAINLPSIVVNSVPAGLWTASYLLLMCCLTKQHSRKIQQLLTLPLPVSAIILELLQLYNWCPGTFDICDLICYLIPLILYIKSI